MSSHCRRFANCLISAFHVSTTAATRQKLSQKYLGLGKNRYSLLSAIRYRFSVSLFGIAIRYRYSVSLFAIGIGNLSVFVIVGVDVAYHLAMIERMPKKAVLFINLGSPDSTSVPDVKRYLDEFLTDPRVIDPPFVRKVIVPLIILNTRPKKSAEAYRSVWTDEGSPLVVTSRKQVELANERSQDPVFMAMRYGNPSIPSVLREMTEKGFDDIYVVPMYPQYAMSSYETVVVKVVEDLKEIAPETTVEFLQPFYNDPQYLDALATSISENLDDSFDRFLFSFHGIPERHLRLTDPSHAHCLCVKDCCTNPNPAHATCYRHQCFYVARSIAERLNFPEDKWFVSFQSRLGRDPWLTPYSDKTIESWAREGVKSIRVVCPAFVTDCLETLEEIAEEAKEIFHNAGGEDFKVIPCLNEHPLWIDFLIDRITEWSNRHS